MPSSMFFINVFFVIIVPFFFHENSIWVEFDKCVDEFGGDGNIYDIIFLWMKSL